MIRVILEGLVKRYGAVAAVDGVSLELRPGGLTKLSGKGQVNGRKSLSEYLLRRIGQESP